MESKSFCRGLLARTIGVLLMMSVPASHPFQALAKDILGTEKKLYSQQDEELIIRDFFQDRQDGFFIDIGCSDPDVSNTTYYLEKHLNWSGIGVDARAELAPAWKEKRPQSKFFSYLVSDHSATEDVFYVVQYAEGLSSTQKERQFMGKTIKGKERRVPSITLNDLLDENKVTEIDFVSMDIEGAELLAFAGFDIDRFKPELLCVEASPANRAKLLTYFTAHGYERIDKYLKRDRVNWYFQPKGPAAAE